jgi:intracellular multiplication protein IcmE
MNKPNDDPLDQTEEFDTDLGFDDPAQNAGQKNNALLKIGLVAGGLVAVVIALFMMGGSGTQAPQSSVATAPTDANALPAQQEPTPELRQALENYNREKIETAEETGTSVVPIAIDPGQAPLQGQAVNAQDDAAERLRRIQEEYERAQQQQVTDNQRQQMAADAQARASAVQTKSQSMSTYLSSAMSARQPGGMSEMDIGYSTGGGMGGGVGDPGMGGGAGAPIGGGAAPTEPTMIIPAAAVEYGQLLIEANTDARGPVLAILASGKLSGARLLGNFQNSDDYITLNFNQLVTKDGRSLPIQAIALDPGTTLPGMITEIDRKYFQRYIIPAAADFISGVGEALAETQVSAVQTDSSTTVSSDDPDFDEAIAQGISDSFDGIADAVKDQASRAQPMLRVAAGTPIGILFTQPVLDQTNAERAQAQAAQMAAQQAASGGPGMMQQFPFAQGSMPYMMMPGAVPPGYGFIPGAIGDAAANMATPATDAVTNAVTNSIR